MVTYALIAINVLIWAAIMIWPSLVDVFSQHDASLCTFGRDGFLDVDRARCLAAGGSYAAGIDNGAWWQLFTSIFAHQQIWHIGANMLSLWMIGPLVEGALGRVRYLVAYLIAGLAGSFLVLALAPHGQASLGASGAIFGLLGILVVLFLRRGLPMQQLGSVVLLNFVITFTVPNISWEAHLGGFLAGLGIGALVAYTPLGRRR